MTNPREILSRLAARVGNWNDRHFAADTKAESPAFYRSLDRLVSRLYVQGDKAQHSDGDGDG
jgi:hypothetical protein